MDIVTGALPSLIPKLADLVAGEYNLQQGLKGEIIWLQAELESVRGALVDISKVPADQLDNSSKTWSRDMRYLSYDLESSIDRFMVRCKRDETAKHHGFKDVINSSLDWLMLPMIRHKFAAKIRNIKSQIGEVHKRHHIHKVDVYKNVAIDAHVLAMFEKQENELLVGIDSAREELIKIMMEGNEAEMQQGKIVSIVGTGGLGKTTLAKVVYDKLRAQFSCSAFVSVSRTPNLEGLFNDLLFKFGKTINNQVLDDLQPINLLREFLQNKRYENLPEYKDKRLMEIFLHYYRA
jgi:ATPase subunit of ABC transporter with duplicated ATPase domains